MLAPRDSLGRRGDGAKEKSRDGEKASTTRQQETKITRFLNAIENIAKTEGPEAITSDRIQGMRELFEEVIWADPILGLNTQKDN